MVHHRVAASDPWLVSQLKLTSLAVGAVDPRIHAFASVSLSFHSFGDVEPTGTLTMPLECRPGYAEHSAAIDYPMSLLANTEIRISCLGYRLEKNKGLPWLRA